MNETFEQLLKSVPEKRCRTIEWALDNHVISGDDYNLMLSMSEGLPGYVIDLNEFNAIIRHEDKLWNIRLKGHDHGRIQKTLEA